MSRVFEALARAGGEKQWQVERPVEKIQSADTEEAALDEKTQMSGPQFEANSTVGKANGADPHPYGLSPQVANGNKPWRERIEEWLFGWDLRRYTSYPLAALEKGSPASEQYKMLREQIKRLQFESGVRVVSVSSPLKGDGKTTVAANVAVALALNYEGKVLLIDGDLRSPSLHRFFNLRRSPGLADYLGANSESGVRSLIQETFLPGLRVLPAGKATSFSSELLAKEKMKHLMEQIREEFVGYQVIVDTPPILSTSDPMVLARYVDGVLMVVRAGKTPRDLVSKALQTLDPSKVLGVVLNGAELGPAYKHYYYSVKRTN